MVAGCHDPHGLGRDRVFAVGGDHERPSALRDDLRRDDEDVAVIEHSVCGAFYQRREVIPGIDLGNALERPYLQHVGDYVLTGGELPALVLVDAMTRLVPGVVGEAESLVGESFVGRWLDHPHYTRPASFRGREVPAVLVSGNHAEIDAWRRRERIRRTKARRPDLIDETALTDEERRELKATDASSPKPQV